MRVAAGLQPLLQRAAQWIGDAAAASSGAGRVTPAELPPASLVRVRWLSQRLPCHQQLPSCAVQCAHAADAPPPSPTGMPACVVRLCDFAAARRIVSAATATTAAAPTAVRRRPLGTTLGRQCNVAVRQRGDSAVVEPSSVQGMSTEAGSVASPAHGRCVLMQDILTVRQSHRSAGLCPLRGCHVTASESWLLSGPSSLRHTIKVKQHPDSDPGLNAGTTRMLAHFASSLTCLTPTPTLTFT